MSLQASTDARSAVAPGPAPGAGRAEPLVRLSGVTRRFGAHVAVHPVDLAVHRHDFVAILGPSGCGKTSLLRMIGGFLEPSGGTIEIAGRDVTRLPPDRRPTNMVFQGYGLFPHMTVRQNVAYGLRIARVSAAERDRRVEEALALVHMESFADRLAPQLSGGQAQRVALARTLVMRPEVLLLDEPLAALDLKLRKTMQEELRGIHRSIGGTFVFVTHDQEEAMALANRILVMQDGRVVQEGGPTEIYGRPATRFVATFVGDANLFDGRRAGGRVDLDIGPAFADAGRDGPVTAVVRPQAITLETGPAAAAGAAGRGGDRIALDGRLVDIVPLGPSVKFLVAVGDREIAVTRTVTGPVEPLEIGSRVVLSWRPADQVVIAGGPAP
ncbi:MAG: ABC transporter ATP-binding protein [Azospirillaceae bacterium]